MHPIDQLDPIISLIVKARRSVCSEILMHRGAKPECVKMRDIHFECFN